jgi:hypothetical protein
MPTQGRAQDATTNTFWKVSLGKLSNKAGGRPEPPYQNPKPLNKLAVAFVTEVLRNVGPSVTRLSPTCYGEPLEQLYDGDRAGNIGCTRPYL